MADLFGSVGGRRPLLAAEFRLGAGVIVVTSAGLVAVLGALFAHQGRSDQLDTAVDRWVESRLDPHQGALSVLAGLGDPAAVTIVTFVVVLACLVTRRVRGALLAAVSVPGAAGVTEFLIKPLVDRTRYTSLSFPSGHTTGISAFAVVLAVLVIGPQRPPLPATLRVSLVFLGSALAIAVAVALIALGKHYFTDTIAGAAVGLSAVLLTALVLDRVCPAPDRVLASTFKDLA
jgi:membrane-associated phospholipid phosphatase